LPESSRTPRARPSPALLVLLALCAAWGARFIWLTSFDVGHRRFFCLFDDAMISMTYARNLVEGYGLNWARQGLPVEGFTHPLWTFLMIPVNASGLPLLLRSLPIQVVCLALLLLHVLLVHRLVVRHFSAPGARSGLPVAVLTAFYYPLNYWTLLGMETGLQAVLTTGSVLLALDMVGATNAAKAADTANAAQAGRDRHLPLFLLGAAAYLLRMDMLLMVVAVQLFVLAFRGLPGRGMGREESRHWLLGAALFAAALLGYSAFRWLYFHDVLPNTYYLKLTGVALPVRLLRGFTCLEETLAAHWGVLLPVAGGTAWVLARGGRAERKWALPAGLFLLYCAYSAWVGGDAWEQHGGVQANRFIAFVFPLVFVLGNGLLNRVIAELADRFRRRPRLIARALPALATAAALFAANALWPFGELDERWRDLAVTRPPVLIISHHIVYIDTRNLQKIALPGAAVATVWAGIPAYLTDWKMIDLLGYNDTVIAREGSAQFLSPKTFKSFWPGHVKWDYEHVLEAHHPDAFLQLWGLDEGMSRRLFRPRGFRRINGFWVRKGSRRVDYTASAVP
jgi:hypothetical protein